jgi:hypothetical protein
MTSYKANLVDIDLMYISQTEKGLAVRQSEEYETFWLPKSQIEFEDKEYRRHAIIRVAMPEWLASKHDLV